MTEPQTKTCQSCKQDFVIEPDDFAFYEKIKVPPPTWCWECRMRRQMCFRNERALYKRKSDVPGRGAELISNFSPDTRVKVYDKEYWWSDEWDPLSFGREYDFSKPFFAQFQELFYEVPWPNLFSKNVVGSDYCNTVIDLKNCYLVFGAGWCENVLYSNSLDYTKDSVDLLGSVMNELCYDCVICYECYRVLFSAFCTQCSNSIFLLDCVGCTDCFCCVGLKNKSYHIFNTPYTKEEYFKELEKYDLGGFACLSKVRGLFSEFVLKYPRKYARIHHSVNVTGDEIYSSRNAKQCFFLAGEGDKENLKYVYNAFGKSLKEAQSVCVGGESSSFVYDSASVIAANNVVFSKKIWTGHDIQYSFNCHDSHRLFACIGLRNKHHCILNQQYTKEEYEALVPRIIAHINEMPYVDRKGREYRYGEFFPPELSPFAYNETIAQEYFPLTKAEAEEQGYRWKDPDPKQYTVTKEPGDLPDHIKEVDNGILSEVIGCAHSTGSGQAHGGKCNHQCTAAFKVVPEELAFYRRMNLPLPRLCPNCRHYQRLRQRNPLKLWHRKCQCAGAKSENGAYRNTAKHPHGDQPCPNEFETSYSPERKEIVYCESCYNAEVV